MGMLQEHSNKVLIKLYDLLNVFKFSHITLNAGSTYGGVLDMVTDRVSTCGLLVILSNLYPTYSFYFISLIVIDIFSHWFHVMR